MQENVFKIYLCLHNTQKKATETEPQCPCKSMNVNFQGLFFPILAKKGSGFFIQYDSKIFLSFIECGQEHEIRFGENINRISNFRPLSLIFQIGLRNNTFQTKVFSIM